MGVKKSDTKNHQAAVNAVSPVRPPSLIPAALSMNAATCALACGHCLSKKRLSTMLT